MTRASGTDTIGRPAALTADLFQSITGGLRQRGEGGHRTEIRAGFRCRVTIHPSGQDSFGAPRIAWCRDLSANGLSLLAEAPLRVGWEFELHLPWEDGEKPPLQLRYVVVRCRKGIGGACQIGARLSRPDAPPPPPPGDPSVNAEIDRIRNAILH